MGTGINNSFSFSLISQLIDMLLSLLMKSMIGVYYSMWLDVVNKVLLQVTIYRFMMGDQWHEDVRFDSCKFLFLYNIKYEWFDCGMKRLTCPERTDESRVRRIVTRIANDQHSWAAAGILVISEGWGCFERTILKTTLRRSVMWMESRLCN